MALPFDSVDRLACCSFTSRAARGSLRHVAALTRDPPPPTAGCNKRNRRSGGVESDVEVARMSAYVRGGPVDDVRVLPLRKGSLSWLPGR
jgi:hypothetical protein